MTTEFPSRTSSGTRAEPDPQNPQLQSEVAPVAWIGGVGASAGLGAALARRFASAGYLVALSGRSPDRLGRVAREIVDAGGRALVLPLDLGNEDAVAEAVAILAERGPLVVAVFNAGGAVRAPTLALTASQFEQTWRNSTLAGFLFARAALRAMLASGREPSLPQGRGTLLFTGATAALRGRPPYVAFAAAKAALRSLAQTLAREYGPEGIHVAHVVIDGGIDGERLRSSAPSRVDAAGLDGLLQLDALAEAYWQLHNQHRSAWSQELDLRPYREPF